MKATQLTAAALTLGALMMTGCGPNGSYVVLVTATPESGVQPAGPSGQPIAPAQPGFSPPAEGIPQNLDPAAVPTPTFIPTPNPTRTAILDPTEDQYYVVQFGDTLSQIAGRYGVTVESIVASNGLPNENTLVIGQTLLIPQNVGGEGPSFKILPDSEVIYGPSVQGFSVEAYLENTDGFLARYTEELDGRLWTGAEIVERVALEQSLNPRMLLALLEYESGWVTQPMISQDAALYPLNYAERPGQIYGLYRQLDWAGRVIQSGYYGWRQRGLSATLLADGTRIQLNQTINAGTAGLQTLLSQTRTRSTWDTAVRHTGYFATYNVLFGDPFARAVEPLIPANLQQPPLELPWAANETWYYTGGPHGGWGSGSSWAALDFVPVAEVQGCNLPDEYAAAVANGVIARSEHGIVILDLDGDGFEGTGWTIFYLHMSSENRQVREGQRVRVGDPLGLPSCEGGVSFASHLHIARRYNGEWIAADCTDCALEVPAPPFVMDGWQAFTFNSEYDGSLIRGDDYREACACRADYNTFSPQDRSP